MFHEVWSANGVEFEGQFKSIHPHFPGKISISSLSNVDSTMLLLQNFGLAFWNWV